MTEQEKGGRTPLYVRLAPAMFVVGLGFMLSQIFANAGPASADDPNGKITICHATGSSTNPFVLITVDEHAGPAHLGGPNVNGNGNAEHKGHGDIRLNPGSVNAGTIGHGPITAAECEQLAGGAAAAALAPSQSTATAESDNPTKDELEDVDVNTSVIDEAEDLQNSGHGHPSAIASPDNSGTPPTRGSTRSTAVHSTESAHQPAGGSTPHQSGSQGGAGSPTSIQAASGGTGSNTGLDTGKTNRQNGVPGPNGNGGANANKTQSNGASPQNVGGHQSVNQGHHR